MTKRSKQKIVISIMLVLPVILALNCFLYPPEIRYSSYLVPILTGSDPAYSIDEEMSSVTYDLGGNSIIVRYMKESDLNALFPREPVGAVAAGREPPLEFQKALAADFLQDVCRLSERFEAAPKKWRARYESLLIGTTPPRAPNPYGSNHSSSPACQT